MANGDGDVRAGVPQGSIIHPLYSIYRFRICLSFKYLKFHQYANNEQVYLSLSLQNLDQISAQVNGNIHPLADFYKKHRLQINSSKLCVILFGKSKQFYKARERLNVGSKRTSLPHHCLQFGALHR